MAKEFTEKAMKKLVEDDIEIINNDKDADRNKKFIKMTKAEYDAGNPALGKRRERCNEINVPIVYIVVCDTYSKIYVEVPEFKNSKLFKMILTDLYNRIIESYDTQYTDNKLNTVTMYASCNKNDDEKYARITYDIIQRYLY